MQEVPRPVAPPGGVLVRTTHSVISIGTEKMKVEQAKMNLLQKAKARPDQVRKVLETARNLGWKSAYEKVRNRLSSPTPLGYSAAGVVEAVDEVMALVEDLEEHKELTEQMFDAEERGDTGNVLKIEQTGGKPNAKARRKVKVEKKKPRPVPRDPVETLKEERRFFSRLRGTAREDAPGFPPTDSCPADFFAGPASVEDTLFADMVRLTKLVFRRKVTCA